MHRREARVAAALPRARPAPRPARHVRRRRLDRPPLRGDRRSPAGDAVAGGRPHRGPRRVGRSPRGPDAVPDRGDRARIGAGGDLFSGWRSLAEAAELPDGLDEWSRRHLDRLAATEPACLAAIDDGDTLLHGDIRSDNVLLGQAGPVFIDWPHASRGRRSATWSDGRRASRWRAAPSPPSSWPASVRRPEPTPTPSPPSWPAWPASSPLRHWARPSPVSPGCARSRTPRAWRREPGSGNVPAGTRGDQVSARPLRRLLPGPWSNQSNRPVAADGVPAADLLDEPPPPPLSEWGRRSESHFRRGRRWTPLACRNPRCGGRRLRSPPVATPRRPDRRLGSGCREPRALVDRFPLPGQGEW